MNADLLEETKHPPSMIFLLELLTGDLKTEVDFHPQFPCLEGAASEFPGNVPRTGKDIWRTEDLALIVILTRYG